MLSQELINLSTEVGGSIASKAKDVINTSLLTLKAVKLRLHIKRSDLDTPLIDIVSRFTVEGIDWKTIIGKIVEFHKETKPRSVKVFSWERRYKNGTLILPSNEKGFIYEFDGDYDMYSGLICYNKYALDIGDKGELPEMKIGALVAEGLTMKPFALDGSRVFLTLKIFKDEMFKERNLYRSKLASSLLQFTTLVVNNIKQR